MIVATLRQETAARTAGVSACLEVIGPTSMADAEPAPRAHAQALVAPANQFQLFPKCQPAEGTPTLPLNSQDFGTSRWQLTI
jgi:hypothetical protein